MKVIFRVIKDMPKEDRANFAKRLLEVWEHTKDKDSGCMVCFGDDVEVYVVDRDSEIEVEDEIENEERKVD